MMLYTICPFKVGKISTFCNIKGFWARSNFFSLDSSLFFMINSYDTIDISNKMLCWYLIFTVSQVSLKNLIFTVSHVSLSIKTGKTNVFVERKTIDIWESAQKWGLPALILTLSYNVFLPRYYLLRSELLRHILVFF